MTADTQADLAFFKATPGTNFRVRDPLPGEVDELARTLLPRGVEWDGGFAIPVGHRAQVVAMRLPLRRVARFLSAVPADDAGPLAGFSCTPIVLGARVALA